ncbi:YXWGXW repeat-containing protein [Mucilaginibacter lappiensis]|uniref:YXWGXW repeat-containing protein n=1 Tax=Mucilaginibacter lappiensis TaxID=354630 RepID=A0ABR6PPX7_9SPHI|nr:YXWGXW repeat-containing protein [Mucilaginibacter lappiensis]MBB6111828.1 hypothetical protein [Mucilaginibacter lappiensis]SIR88272.1 YXWGXW repeat-containing protein [Mucilaginibacter lappiensis]
MKKTFRILMVLLVTSLATVKTYAQISIGVSVRIAPPALPVYTQPACPVDGYLWTPGYWAYAADGGYYWVPGVWIAPPRVGFLWTPGYWGYDGSIYAFHQGYWGRHIGFYGGVNYGYGYGGAGYVGGRWAGNSFQYNTAVVNVNNTVVHNTYINKTVINNNVTVNNNHTSFNGPGGVSATPRPDERAAEREQHVQPTNDQMNHQQVAGKDHNQFASANNGRPATAAMNKVDGNRFNTEGRKARASNPDGTNNNVDRNNRPQANNAADNHANPDNANKNASPGDQAPRAPHQHQAVNNPNGQPGQNQQHNNMARAPRQLVRHPAPGRPHNNPKPQEHEKHR